MFLSKMMQPSANARHGFEAEKYAVNYGRSTNLLEPVRMALCGSLIALLGKPQQRFYVMKYTSVVK